MTDYKRKTSSPPFFFHLSSLMSAVVSEPPLLVAFLHHLFILWCFWLMRLFLNNPSCTSILITCLPKYCLLFFVPQLTTCLYPTILSLLAAFFDISSTLLFLWYKHYLFSPLYSSLTRSSAIATCIFPPINDIHKNKSSQRIRENNVLGNILDEKEKHITLQDALHIEVHQQVPPFWVVSPQPFISEIDHSRKDSGVESPRWWDPDAHLSSGLAAKWWSGKLLRRVVIIFF